MKTFLYLLLLASAVAAVHGLIKCKTCTNCDEDNPASWGETENCTSCYIFDLKTTLILTIRTVNRQCLPTNCTYQQSLSESSLAQYMNTDMYSYKVSCCDDEDYCNISGSAVTFKPLLWLMAAGFAASLHKLLS